LKLLGCKWQRHRENSSGINAKTTLGKRKRPPAAAAVDGRGVTEATFGGFQQQALTPSNIMAVPFY